MITKVEEFRRKNKFVPLYVPTTPKEMQEFLHDKTVVLERENEWIVCIEDDIPIAYFKHVWHEESDHFILQNIEEFE